MSATRVLLYAMAGLVTVLIGLALCAAVTGDGLVGGVKKVGVAACTGGWGLASFSVPALGTAASVTGIVGYAVGLALLAALLIRALRWALAIG